MHRMGEVCEICRFYAFFLLLILIQKINTVVILYDNKVKKSPFLSGKIERQVLL